MDIKFSNQLLAITPPLVHFGSNNWSDRLMFVAELQEVKIFLTKIRWNVGFL